MKNMRWRSHSQKESPGEWNGSPVGGREPRWELHGSLSNLPKFWESKKLPQFKRLDAAFRGVDVPWAYVVSSKGQLEMTGPGEPH